MSRNPFDQFSCVDAICLLKDGELAGKIIAKWTPSGNCNVFIQLHELDENGYFKSAWGKATVYGYDKLSAAIYDALKKMDKVERDHTLLGQATFYNSGDDRKKQKAAIRKIVKSGKIPVYSGTGNQQDAFEAAGYKWIKIV